MTIRLPMRTTSRAERPACSGVPRRLCTATLLLLLATACSPSSGANDPTPRRMVGEITRVELEGTSFLDAYSAVAQLRPAWVHPRPALSIVGSDPFPVVYVDGLARGSVDELRRLATSEIERLSYLSPSDATTRFGTGHTSGAILVTTVSGR